MSLKDLTRTVWEGETLRVSVVYDWHYYNGPENNGYDERRAPKAKAVIEKIAGHNLQGEKQWVVIEQPTSAVMELAEGLLYMAGVERLMKGREQRDRHCSGIWV